MTVRRVIVDHVDIPDADLETSIAFYKGTFAPLGFFLTDYNDEEGYAGFGVDGLDDGGINRHGTSEIPPPTLNTTPPTTAASSGTSTATISKPFTTAVTNTPGGQSARPPRLAAERLSRLARAVSPGRRATANTHRDR